LTIAVVALVLAQLVVALAEAVASGRWTVGLALAQVVALAALDLRFLILVLSTPAAPIRLRFLR